MKNNLIETFMGAIVLAIAGFFLAFAYTTSGLKNDFNSHYTAAFDRVDGLQLGGEVRISGVKIGTIKEINIEPKTFMAQVEIVLKDSIKLPTDTSAEIVSDGFLGGKYMALIPGGDETYLESGQAISYTQSSISLEAMIGQLIFSNKKDKDSKEDKISQENAEQKTSEVTEPKDVTEPKVEAESETVIPHEPKVEDASKTSPDSTHETSAL